MKFPPIAFCLFFIGGVLAAQTPAAAPATTPAPFNLNTLLAAQQVRGALAASIVNGSVQADAALAQLQGLAAPMGLSIDPAAGFGYAAIDVGHRLIAAGRPDAAEVFFKAAEASLAALIQKTPDTQPWDKAQFLQQLSLIRSHYLNNPVQAKADIDQAIALEPNDALLQRQRTLLVNEHGNLFTAGTPSQ